MIHFSPPFLHTLSQFH